MAVDTKQAIIDCTISLAETKPIKKITINDIAKECNITRNTFYYYFHDIYDVLDNAIAQEVVKLENCDPSQYDKALFDIIEFAVMYKKVWRNLYKTVGQEQLQKYVVGRLHSIFVKYIMLHVKDYKISDMDLNIICTYFEEALFGVMARWIRGEGTTGTREEMHQISDRIRILFAGCIELMLNNIKNHPNEFQ